MEKAARWCQACLEMRLIVFAPLLLASVSLSGAETQAVHVATPDADGIQRIRIVGGDYFFKPARIVVKANTPVELVVSKEAGMVPHNLVIDAPAAGVRIKEDLSTDAKRISFTATAPGTYSFYCEKKLLFFRKPPRKGHGRSARRSGSLGVRDRSLTATKPAEP